MKVLVVDDDVDIRETLVEVFLDEGYEVVAAGDGAQAMVLLRTEAPCVVVLDLLMPNVGGTEVYARMQSDAVLSLIPVVISTSDPSRAPAGATVVRKPVDLERMVDLVRRLCSDRGHPVTGPQHPAGTMT